MWEKEKRMWEEKERTWGEKGRGSERGCGGRRVRERRRRRVWSKKWEDGRSEGVRK